MYQIVIDRHAQKQLGKIAAPYFNRIVKAINQLAANPRPGGAKNLQPVRVTGYEYAIIVLSIKLNTKF